MVEINSCVFLSLILINLCICADVFHEGSKIRFNPNSPAEFFGYSVAFSASGLIVGAPKATTGGNNTGVVFNCPLNDLKTTNVSCVPLILQKGKRNFQHGMWFGASLAVGPTGKMVICAPRWARRSQHYINISDVNGACYLKMKRLETFLFPMDAYNKQLCNINNSRIEFLGYHNNNTKMTSVNYYAKAQVGMAIKVTEDRIIIGSPGLFAWSGGIVQYTYNPEEKSVKYSPKATYNPYFTHDVGPDEYFGYSVESGVFEDGGDTFYVVGGPRANQGYGMVLVIEPATSEAAPLNILAKLKGPQLGAYFGASLSCVDINADGRIDLLVGAPSYVKQFPKDDVYDQGAVFVYLNKEQATGFILEYAGLVRGSKANGAKFGYSIAELGDVDADGYKDVAVSSPWENQNRGVVYIYKGDTNGLRSRYIQRIVASDARGFGMSLTKGFDVDHNNCNDFVVGAYESSAVYMYRCVPTVKVQATINIPESSSLPQNTTNFTAQFCIYVQPLTAYKNLLIEFNATIAIDPEGNRATIAGTSEYAYKLSTAPSSDYCDNKIIEIMPAADLSRPILLKFDLELIDRMQDNPNHFKIDAARVSEYSQLHSSLHIQLVKECGQDLTCTPWLEMDLEAINEPYIPGSEGRLGAIIRVLNKEEPAFGICINLTLPSLPKRVPNTCILKGLKMTCDLPSPFHRNQTVMWEVELEYTKDMRDMGVTILDATIHDPVTDRVVSNNASQYLEITIMPVANISISGKALPNATMSVSREKLSDGRHVPFIHYFQVINAGPSDWHELTATILVTGKVSLGKKEINGCEESWESGSLVLACTWSVNAKQSLPIELPMRYDLAANGEEVNTTYNITTTLYLDQQNKSLTLTTTLTLEHASNLWIIIIVAAAIGLLFLAILSYTLYKGTARPKKEQLENEAILEKPDCSSELDAQPEQVANGPEENISKPACSVDNSNDLSELWNGGEVQALNFQGPSNEYNPNVAPAPTTISESTALYVCLQKQLRETDIGQRRLV